MASHISSQRKEKAQENIESKIQILEGYLVHGIPENAFVPRNMTQFRLWEDCVANLARIGSPNTMDKPHNNGLKTRIEGLLNELAKRKHKRQSRRSEVDSLKIEVREKDRLVRDLTDQWHAKKHECDRAQQSERRLLNRVSELQRDNGELTQKLASLIPLRPL
jgi:hypothetical protein